MYANNVHHPAPPTKHTMSEIQFPIRMVLNIILTWEYYVHIFKRLPVISLLNNLKIYLRVFWAAHSSGLLLPEKQPVRHDNFKSVSAIIRCFVPYIHWWSTSCATFPIKAESHSLAFFPGQFRTDNCTERDSPVEASLDLPSD